MYSFKIMGGLGALVKGLKGWTCIRNMKNLMIDDLYSTSMLNDELWWMQRVIV